MAAVQDPYLRERMADFDDLGNRLLQHLSASSDAPVLPDRPAAEGIVVFARSLGPAELLDYDPDRLRGIVLEEGAPTAHVAIMARAMDIPIVGRVAGCLGRVEAGDPIIVDGDNAQVFVRPTEDVRTLFENSVRDRAERLALYAALRDLEPVSRDGVRISLNQNAGLLVEMNDFADHGSTASGCTAPRSRSWSARIFPMSGSRPKSTCGF